MSSGKKQKKRKWQSPPPPSKLKPQLAQRLHRLRSGQRDLWADDDDIQSKSKQSKKNNNNHSLSVLLSDSDEDKPRMRSIKSGKRISKTHDETHNCCSNHLSILKNHSGHSSQTINTKYLPDKVMIVPITDEIIQKYLDPQQIYQLRAQISSSKTNKRISTSNLANKATMTSDISEIQHPVIKIPRVKATLSDMDIEPLASSIVVESTCLNSATSNVQSCSTEHNMEENTHTNEKSPTDIITIDSDTSDNQHEEFTEVKSKKQDPWIPISDEIDNTLEQVLNQVESSEHASLEFTPATARRTNTEIMAALLPKIPLKQGRFRHGKPINNRSIPNVANEYRPVAIVSSSPQPVCSASKSDASTTIINIENDTTSINMEHIDDTANQLSTSDETNQYNIVPMMAEMLTDENLSTIDVANDNPTTETGDQNALSSISNEKTTTPSRISYRLNPDGTRVSISRPLLPTSRQSPLIHSLRRTSTDVTPIQSNKT